MSLLTEGLVGGVMPRGVPGTAVGVAGGAGGHAARAVVVAAVDGDPRCWLFVAHDGEVEEKKKEKEGRKRGSASSCDQYR